MCAASRPCLIVSLVLLAATFPALPACSPALAQNAPPAAASAAPIAPTAPAPAAPAAATACPYFGIQVVDDATGRGVPLVELTTTNSLRFVTDSAGWVAFNEPGLMNAGEVYFAVRSHGYEYPKDGFGFRGVRLKPVPGGRAVVKIKRLNLAQRLYRMTGQGIYRDSLLLGLPAPTRNPVLNGRVMGQDSVQNLLYRGKIRWFWGDTGRPEYPLGNFHMSGAVSDLPDQGGLDPALGVDLFYFVNKEGFSRGMVDAKTIPGPGPIWLSGYVLLTDPQGQERMVAHYARVKDVGAVLERGTVVYDDKDEVFRRLAPLPDKDETLHLEGHPLRIEEDGSARFYCGFGPPFHLRVKADWKSALDPAQFEGFTPLAPGTRFDGAKTKLDRADGKLVIAWKKNTPPLTADQRNQLVKAGLLGKDEIAPVFRDASGKAVTPHGGSIYWNAYRKRYIAIFNEMGGSSSVLGEVWYAEADRPEGPFRPARKIVTHDRYTIYNPKHHPLLDQEGGRIIYFEGTYANSFSGNPDQTPRYDYNQIMYRLDLDTVRD